MVNYTIGQHNVGKSMTTMNALHPDLDDYDIVCLQEPYILHGGKIGGIPPDVVPYYSRKRGRAAVAVVNRSYPTMEILTASNIVAVSVDLGPGISVIVASVYLPPQDEVDVEAELDLLRDLLERHKDKSFVIVGDFNAKSTLWGNPLHATDVRGDQVVEFCLENDLQILNDPLSEETFRNANGAS